MLGAFVATAFANLGTILTHEIHILAVACHKLGRQPAESGTIRIQSNTACHSRWIFAFASFGALFTGFCTSNASVNAGLVMIMRNHAILLSLEFGRLRLNQTVPLICTVTHTKPWIGHREQQRKLEFTRKLCRNLNAWKGKWECGLSGLLQLLGVTGENDKQNGYGNPHGP